jgi:hypothetical protein
MDGTLIQMFAGAAHDRLCGRVFGPARWLRPLLVLPLGRRRDPLFLTVILETPGPFCYIAGEDPLDGVDSAESFAHLAGSIVRAVARAGGERILVVRTETTGETGADLELRLLLFGSAGRAELRRGDTVVQSVGGRLQRGAAPRKASAPPLPEGTFWLLSHGRAGRVTPAGQDDPGAAVRFGPFDDPLAACRTVGGSLLTETHGRILSTRLKPLARRLNTRRKLLDRLRSDLERSARHARLRREAETLAAYQSQIDTGASSVELPDVYNPDERLRIELDPALSVVNQVNKRFRLAGKLERSAAHTRRRIEEIGAEVETLAAAIASVDAAPSFAAAMRRIGEMRVETPGTTPTAGRPARERRDAPRGAFRRIELDAMWFVLVGRNNRENDELTFHEAAPTDLWFHAQHVPGSHVVLKSRGNPGAPPPQVLERTAAIAALYSKARHSGLVPVIYTQRKYVRKPRGARPGQVVCEREKMIMVEPGLPPEAEADA